MVSDLIEHEMQEVVDESALDVLKNSQERIYSIAQLHRNLYQQENQKKLNLANYIEKLALNLSESFKRGDQRINITFDLEKLEISTEKAKYFGLITTELLTNAFRHAFPYQYEGVIRLVLKRKSDDCAYFSIYDNGIGIPDKDSNTSSESLGLDLVEIFTKQIGGSFKTIRTNSGISHMRTKNCKAYYNPHCKSKRERSLP